MKHDRTMLPYAAALFAAVMLAQTTVRLDGQEQGKPWDYRTAKVVQVKDAQGKIVLQGTYAVVPEAPDDDDTERRATLSPTAADSDAAGEAEVEFAKEGAIAQEVEFSVEQFEAGAALTFVIDGREVATAKTDAQGQVEVELEVPLPEKPTAP
jgi:hypothetical protein